MAETERTTAVEGLAFTLKDHASAPAEKMASAFEHVHHATERAGERIKEFAHHTAMGALGAVGLGFGLHELADKAKEANLELEGAAKKIAGVHFAFGGWRSDVSAAERWTYSLAEGKEIVDKLEESEGKLKMTRGELAGIYKSAYAIGTRHNLNQEQMLDLTEKLGAAEKVLGTSAEMAAMSISRAVMTGNIRGMDDFNKQLRFSVGNMKDFHKMSEGARFAKIQKAMGDLMPAAEGMGHGMAGAMFDIREAIEDITRDLTGPVFKDVSQSLQSWAKSITRVREDGKSIAAEYGEKLVSAFHTLKDVTSFLVENWKTLAAIWASMKFASWMPVGTGATGAAGAAGMASWFTKQRTAQVETIVRDSLGMPMTMMVNTVKPSFASLASKGLIAAQALGELYLGADALASWIEGKKTEEVATSQKLNIDTVSALMAKGNTRAIEQYMQMGGLGKAAENRNAVEAAFSAMSVEDRERWSKKLRLGDVIRGPAAMGPNFGMQGGFATAATNTNPAALAKAFGESVADALMRSSPLFGQGLGVLSKQWSMLDDVKNDPHVNKKGDQNVNIAHLTLTQEFKEADPDRVFHKAVNEIDHMVNAPRGATTNALGA